jgi:hypothetical protein
LNGAASDWSSIRTTIRHCCFGAKRRPRNERLAGHIGYPTAQQCRMVQGCNHLSAAR